MKIALVHDFLNQWGGAEEVLLMLHEIYPDAPIYTLFHDRRQSGPLVETAQPYEGAATWPADSLHLSGLQRLPGWLRRSRLLMPFYPTAIEMFDLSSYDVVISDSSAFSKGVLTRPGTVHICYCHSPTRYLWDWHERYIQEQRLSWFAKIFIVPFLSYLRIWDRWAADRVDIFLANSRNVQARIQKYYARGSQVIYPPINVLSHARDLGSYQLDRTVPDVYDGVKRDIPYYLIVARLSAYKKIEIAIEACNRLQVPLVIVGTGREIEKLRRLAWGTVTFVGKVTRSELDGYYAKCKALLMPGVEDFGMVMAEAMSFGKPVIAYRAGGALEIVREGISGEFFDKETPRSLMDAIRDFDSKWKNGSYDPEEIFRLAERFDRQHFTEAIQSVVEQSVKPGVRSAIRQD